MAALPITVKGANVAAQRIVVLAQHGCDDVGGGVGRCQTIDFFTDNVELCVEGTDAVRDVVKAPCLLAKL